MRALLVILMAIGLLSCGPSRPEATGSSQASSSGNTPSTQPQTLVVAIRVEPTSLAPLPLLRTGISLGNTLRLFNAGLAIVDNHGQAVPYLAATLPALNTDSWKVFDDGRMETTYTLRP